MALVRLPLPARMVAALSLPMIALLVGCQAEQRPGTVQVIGPNTGSVSVSAVAPASPSSSAPPLSQTALPPEVLALATTSGTTKGDGVLTPGSNVNIYQLISYDVAEITQLTNAVIDGRPLPTADILAVYEQGRAARIGQNTRPLRAFATAPARATEFAEDAGFYKNNTFLDEPVISAIVGTGPAAKYTAAQRRQAVQKGVLRILRYYVVHEMAAAEAKLKDGNTDPVSGAPHNVEEAWAIYVGAEVGGKYPHSLANTALSREANYGRTGQIDQPLREAFARAQQAAAAGDTSAFNQAQADVQSRLNALFYVGAARYLHETVKSVQASKPLDAAVQIVEGYSFYQTVQPQVARADAEADRILTAFYQSDPSTLTAASRDRALEAFNRTAPALGLKSSDLLTAADLK